jgi:hypothetical protein
MQQLEDIIDRVSIVALGSFGHASGKNTRTSVKSLQ